MRISACARPLAVVILLLLATACGGDKSSVESQAETRISSALKPAPALPEPRTVATIRDGVWAFAQDGGYAAWGRPYSSPCGWMIELFEFSAKRTFQVLNRDDCSSDSAEIPSEVIAVASRRVLWVLPSGSNNAAYRDFVVGTAPSGVSSHFGTVWYPDYREPEEGAGSPVEESDPPTLVAGDGEAFVFYAYSERGIEGGRRTDGVWQTVGGQAKQLAAGAVDALAVANRRVATVSDGGRMLNIRRIGDGKVLGAAKLSNRGIAVALSGKLAVVLTTGVFDAALELYGADDAQPVRRIDLPTGVEGPLSISGSRVTLSVGGAFHLIDLDARTIGPVPADNPIGLSIEGNRIAWAEAAGDASLIRVIELSG